MPHTSIITHMIAALQPHLHVVPADADGVELGQVLGAVGKDVACSSDGSRKWRSGQQETVSASHIDRTHGTSPAEAIPRGSVPPKGSVQRHDGGRGISGKRHCTDGGRAGTWKWRGLRCVCFLAGMRRGITHQ